MGISKRLTWHLAAFAVLALMWGLLPPAAFGFTDNVVDQNGVPIAGGFKWLLERDNTHLPRPGVHLPVDQANVRKNTLSISIHKSHAPVVASGVSDINPATIALPIPSTATT